LGTGSCTSAGDNSSSEAMMATIGFMTEFLQAAKISAVSFHRVLHATGEKWTKRREAATA
jgi:hypothetical protein